MPKKRRTKTERPKGSNAKYLKWQTKEKLALLTGWARKGLSNDDIAKNVGVARSTLQEWKRNHKDIADALNTGAREADAVIENALFVRAQGHMEKLKRPYKLREKTFDVNGKLISEREHIEYSEYEEYIPPDTTAQILWLKNRLPDVWRDKINTELGGKVEHIDHIPEEDKELLKRTVERLESYRTASDAE